MLTLFRDILKGGPARSALFLLSLLLMLGAAAPAAAQGRLTAAVEARARTIRIDGPAAPQRSRQRTPRSKARKVAGGIIGGIAGAFGGGFLGAALEGECSCDQPGIRGAIFGAPIGAVIGAVMGVFIASR